MADIPTLDTFLSTRREVLAKGPVALIFSEDAVELASTIRHHHDAGFRSILVLLPKGLSLPEGAPAHAVSCDTGRIEAVIGAVNAIIAAAPPATWVYWGYNAEYLFFPFCETRTVRELLAFHAEERRDALFACVVDLYAPDLSAAPNGVSVTDAMLDRSGYYALARTDPANGYAPKERQLDVFGGLRWRFEEHVAWERRRIDRIALFRTRKDLRMRPDLTFNVEEYNTYACPWHHNLTVAVASFRAAKALKSNPGSAAAISTFAWRNSVPFEWTSRQLMDLGLMEPGQWF
jgi:hypothetical protein